jgi:hypothetical protein
MALDSVLCIITCQETEATGKNLSYSVGQINKKWEEKEYGRPRADEYKKDELSERRRREACSEGIECKLHPVLVSGCAGVPEELCGHPL